MTSKREINYLLINYQFYRHILSFFIYFFLFSQNDLAHLSFSPFLNKKKKIKQMRPCGNHCMLCTLFLGSFLNQSVCQRPFCLIQSRPLSCEPNRQHGFRYHADQGGG